MLSLVPSNKTSAEYRLEQRQVFVDNYREKVVGDLLLIVPVEQPHQSSRPSANQSQRSSTVFTSSDRLSSINEDLDYQSQTNEDDCSSSARSSAARSRKHVTARSKPSTPPSAPPPPQRIDPRRYAKLTLKNGDVYEGQVLFEDGGLMDGQGRIQWTDGQAYEGQFSMNKITGFGKYFWSDGFDYEGELVNGKRHGQGRWLSTKHNLLAEGEWQAGGLHGTASVTYASDTPKKFSYQGEFRDNQFAGKGKMNYPSGNWYEGEWQAGKRHGKGLMVWADRGEQYQGDWKDGLMHGKGEYVWPGFNPQLPFRFPRHNIYRGDWVNGKRSGTGSFYYSTGAWYVGQWKDNQKHGEGMYCGEDGSRLKGQWTNDRFLGQRVTPAESCEFSFDMAAFTKNNSAYSNDPERCNHAVNLIIQRHNQFLRNAYARYFVPLKSGNNPTKIGFTKFNLWTIINDYGIKKLGVTIVEFERCFARRFRNHQLYHEKFYERLFDATAELLFREFLECFIYMAAVLPTPSNINPHDIAAKLNYLLTTCSSTAEPPRIAPAHNPQLEKLFLCRAKPHLTNSLPQSSGDKTMTIREILIMLAEFGPRKAQNGEKITSQSLVSAVLKVAPTAQTAEDAFNLSMELAYYDLLIILANLARLNPNYIKEFTANCERLETLMSY